MHPTAEQGFRRMLRSAEPTRWHTPLRVLDVGGADVNGTVHKILRDVHLIEVLDVLDIEPGQGVTMIGDATDPATLDRIGPEIPFYDLVISTETFEHVAAWDRIVHNVERMLRPGGWFIGTCASFARRPHGARGEHEVPSGEYYGNVSADYLIMFLLGDFDGEVVVEYSWRPNFPTTNDLYWRAQKL